VTKFPKYTELSGQKLERLESGEGHGAASGDPNKKHAQDFSVWFFKAGVHANALQTWMSPWGEGFPGWHIECSAMSKYYLGKTIDIHMGGVEHISIHHTNEIAQSEAANGTRFVNYWLHNEHLLVDGKRMGKSEGNAYVMEDVLKRGFSPLALRYFFLQANYRSKQNFTWEALEAAEVALKKLKNAIADFPSGGKINKDYKSRFQEQINDDFNIAGGLALVWELVKDVHVNMNDKKATILDFDTVLGLKLNDMNIEIIPEAIQKLVSEREIARVSKDFKKSDELRDKISALGYEVKDTSTGQKVSKR
jgi:cysteinyl-tRNA synthetase